MRKKRLTRRLVSAILAASMMMPAFAGIAEAAIATWLSPLPGQKITARYVEVSVGYNTESQLKVTRLELWVDGKLYENKALVQPQSRGVCSFWWDTAKSGRGSHDLVVRIYAGNEQIAVVSGTGTVGEGGYDLRPPTVRFSNIKSGDVLTGTARIEMIASDDSGRPPIVSMHVDNALKMLSNRPPYVCELNTAEYPDGSHELRSVAYDNAGNKSDPAVAKVDFRNNQKRPVVVEMNVGRKSNTIPPSEDDGVGQMLPPIEISNNEVGAARISESAAKILEAGPKARPVAPVTESKVNILSPKTDVVRSSTTSTGTIKRILSTRTSDKRSNDQAGVSERESVNSAPTASSTASVIVPDLRIASEVPQQSGSIAEPTNSNAPNTENTKNLSQPKDLPISSSIQTRSQLVAITPRVPSGPVQPSAQDVPVLSSPDSVMPRVTTSLRSICQAPIILDKAAEPVRSTINVATANPRPVRAAMLPSIRGGMPNAKDYESISLPPPAKKDMRARIEEQTIPASGCVKLRDIFDRLGGVLFWDPNTHTVTGYLKNIVLEMQIGSSVIRINGRKIKISTSPVVVNGRTIIDVGIIHHACELAGLMITNRG